MFKSLMAAAVVLCVFVLTYPSASAAPLSKSVMSEVYSRQVTSVRWMTRSGDFIKIHGLGFHDGLFVEDARGGQWLLHITTPRGELPVLVDAKEMSTRWRGNSRTVDSYDVTSQRKSIGDLMGVAMKRGGYRYLNNNCVHLVRALLKYLHVPKPF